jgi:hypothetical protein
MSSESNTYNLNRAIRALHDISSATAVCRPGYPVQYPLCYCTRVL